MRVKYCGVEFGLFTSAFGVYPFFKQRGDLSEQD